MARARPDLPPPRALHEAGVDVEVLEARDRIGGRVLTITDSHTTRPIELGAEFIHGQAPELQQLLDEASPRLCGRVRHAMESDAHRGLRPLTGFWERLDRAMRLRSASGDTRGPAKAGHYKRQTDRSVDEVLRARAGRTSSRAGTDLRPPVCRGVSRRRPAPGERAGPRRRAAAPETTFASGGWPTSSTATIASSPGSPDRSSTRIRLSSMVTAVRWKPRRVVDRGRTPEADDGTSRRSSRYRLACCRRRPIVVARSRSSQRCAPRRHALAPSGDGRRRPRRAAPQRAILGRREVRTTRTRRKAWSE